jgi:hypothetical protein
LAIGCGLQRHALTDAAITGERVMGDEAHAGDQVGSGGIDAGIHPISSRGRAACAEQLYDHQREECSAILDESIWDSICRTGAALLSISPSSS